MGSRPVKLAAVSYLNTLPMLEGLRRAMSGSAEVILEHPRNCARLLLSGDVDIALCPVGALVDVDNYHIVSDVAIGARGKVRTVAVYSEIPLAELTAIRLSPQSRTSNLLVQILDREYWNHQLQFLPADAALSESIGDLTIGDACFQKEGDASYITDLGHEWTLHTGLPMVFACWVALNPVDDGFLDEFNHALHDGVRRIDELDISENDESLGIREYLKMNIHYIMDSKMREGLETYMGLARSMQLNHAHANSNPPGLSTRPKGFTGR